MSKDREAWRWWNCRESWIDRLLWAGLIAVIGWAVIGWAVAFGVALSGHDTAATWVLLSWAADMMLIIAIMGSADDHD